MTYFLQHNSKLISTLNSMHEAFTKRSATCACSVRNKPTYYRANSRKLSFFVVNVRLLWVAVFVVLSLFRRYRAINAGLTLGQLCQQHVLVHCYQELWQSQWYWQCLQCDKCDKKNYEKAANCGLEQVYRRTMVLLFLKPLNAKRMLMSLSDIQYMHSAQLYLS